MLQRTRWENGRVRHQKNLLKSLNKVLYQFNFSELTPEKEVYSRYIGHYTNKDVEPIKIGYADESLYVTGWGGAKSELVQLNNSLFYAINWNQTFNFSSDDDSTNKVITRFIDRDPVEYQKDEN